MFKTCGEQLLHIRCDKIDDLAGLGFLIDHIVEQQILIDPKNWKGGNLHPKPVMPFHAKHDQKAPPVRFN